MVQPAMRYLYVLSGYADDGVLRAPSDGPAFEYHRFVEETGADVVSLATLALGQRVVPARLAKALLVQRARLAALVAARAGRYDAIVASGEDIGILVALAMRARRRRTPLVVITHGPQFGSAKFRVVLALVKSMPNLVFACLSQSLATLLSTGHGIDPRRCSAVGYGVDTDYYRSAEGSTEPLVASAGTSNRDYETLVRALAGTDLHTRIAAHSTWVGAAAAIGVPVPDHVEVRACSGYDDLRALYRRARVVVVPTRDVPYAAGFAVIAEALATGTPVIATAGRVLSDFIEDGVTGLLVPPGDVDAMRAAILALIDDPDRAARMGVAAAALMRTRFSLDDYVRRLREAAEIAANSGGRS
ncbi:Glycosyltransferase involved in cell wall bisynthesis [Sphingomonas guangdongensis]|uniref:Glycosyltransferase involved in cell wall bisynthesis n=1 Tax=Sphingomonas guangdongensis TaxID=1141890 RepID=A0A285QM22_9SPHN|nr:glycosyltransferase family 4 protein [Sphingomonas guangdongensis]SOB81142.1 Glycosyltransferase involved in cell wall bisynthesis [Sphingomonas guangdongensis]